MKVTVSIALEEDDVDVLKEFCAKVGVPMSKLFQAYASGMVGVIKASGADKRVRLSAMDLVKFVGRGLATTP